MAKKSPSRSTAPNYVKWCQMALWTVEEAIALSLGLDPASLPSQDNLEKARYEERREIVNRANDAGLLSIDGHMGMARIQPDRFLSWAKSRRIDVPRKLLETVKAYGGRISYWPAEIRRLNKELDALKVKNETSPDRKAKKVEAADDKPLNEAERRVVRTIIIAMAVSRYKFDPKAVRNSTAREIVSDVATLGIKRAPDENTVRNWLSQSSKLLPKRDEATPGN